MNQNILQKAITELKSPNPRMDYVLGMLETLYEMQDKPKDSIITLPGGRIINATELNLIPHNADDASILDAKARAAIEQVKAMSEASKE